jgi:hypothetical protein
MSKRGIPCDWRTWTEERAGSASEPVLYHAQPFGRCWCGNYEQLLAGEPALPHGLCVDCRGSRAEVMSGLRCDAPMRRLAA